MKIYFAHAKKDYDTEYELNCMNKIKELYPDSEIINPKDIIIPTHNESLGSYGDLLRDMRECFFPVIDTCDLLIVARNKSGNSFGGTKKEIEHSYEKIIKVEYLNVSYPEDNRPTVNCYICKRQLIEGVDTLTAFVDDGVNREYVCIEHSVT